MAVGKVILALSVQFEFCFISWLFSLKFCMKMIWNQIIRIVSWFFFFLEVWMKKKKKKNDVHIFVWYNQQSIHTSRKRKKSTNNQELIVDFFRFLEVWMKKPSVFPFTSDFFIHTSRKRKINKTIVVFFRFLEVWMKRPSCTLYCGRSPPYENVHVGFFIHTSRKWKKKSTVNSYNLISHHFHTNLRENSHKIKQNSNWTESARIYLTTAMADYSTSSWNLWKNSKRLNKGCSNCFHFSSVSDVFMHSSSLVQTLLLWHCLQWRKARLYRSLTLRHVTENRYVKYTVHKIHGDMNQLF